VDGGCTSADSKVEVIRILHVVVAGDIGGAERLLLDLVRHADPKRVEHAVLLFTPNPALRDYLAPLRVFDAGHAPETPLAFLRRSYGSDALAWCERIARRERAAVVHVHTLGSHMLGARLGSRLDVPVVRTEHHYNHFRDPSAAPFTRNGLHGTARVVAISAFVATQFAREAPEHAHKLTTIRNGIDLARFAYAPPADASPVMRFAIACRLERWKGVHLAIEALSDVPDATLDIAGVGAETRALEALAARCGLQTRVRFHGRVEDIATFYGRADVALNCSEREPLGLSVLEALAVGRPVVAFAQGGIPEIVQDGSTGFLASERSASALALAMQRALHARATHPAMGKAAHAFTAQNASAARMSALYTEMYEALS
jgi:L-malate glycosyltransferase